MNIYVTPLISRQFNKVLCDDIPWKELFLSGNLDKVHINCSDIDQDLITSKSEKAKYIQKLNGNFYSGKRYSFNGIEFSLMRHKKTINGKPTAWKWQIQINPGHFYSYSLFSDYIRQITKGSDHCIRRIDFSSLVKAEYFNMQFFFETMHFTGKKVSSWYGKSIHVDNYLGPKVTLTCGKFPHRLTIYLRDKYGKKINTFKNAHAINIEVQCSKEEYFKNIGIVKIEDLPKVLGVNPFNGLEFYDVYNPRQVSNRKMNKIQKIILDSKIDGLHNSIKLNNESKHFYDRYLPHFDFLRIGREEKRLSYLIKINFKNGFRRWLNR